MAQLEPLGLRAALGLSVAQLEPLGLRAALGLRATLWLPVALGLPAALGLPLAQLEPELPELRVLQLVALLLRGGCMREKGILAAADANRQQAQAQSPTLRAQPAAPPPASTSSSKRRYYSCTSEHYVRRRAIVTSASPVPGARGGRARANA